MIGHIPGLMARERLHHHKVMSALPLAHNLHSLLARNTVIHTPGAGSLVGRKRRIIVEMAETHILQILTLAHVRHLAGIDERRLITLTLQRTRQRRQNPMHLRMLHQTDIRITQPAVESRHSAPVRTERVAIKILPEDTLRNHTAQTRSNTGQTTQFLHKTAAETLHENHQHIRPPRRKQRVADITARLRIKTPHKVRILPLGKKIITPGEIIAQPYTRSKSKHRIHRSMVGQNLAPRTVNITLTHKPQARHHQENPDNADIAHP